MKGTVFGIFDIGIEKGKNMNTDIHSHLLDSEISMNHLFELKGIYQCVSIHHIICIHIENLPLVLRMTMTTESQH